MNRKLGVIFLAVSLMGCGASGALANAPAVSQPVTQPEASAAPAKTELPAPVQTETPVPEETAQTSDDYLVAPDTVDSSAEPVVWIHQPDLGFTGIEELKCEHYLGWELTVTQELIGYPQEWNNPVEETLGLYSDTYDGSGFFCNRYSADAVRVLGDNVYGVYDYTGSPLYGMSGIFCQAYPAGGFCNYGIDGTLFYLSDFRHVVKTDKEGGFGGYWPYGYSIVKDELVYVHGKDDIEPADSIPGDHGEGILVQIFEGENFNEDDIIGYRLFKGGKSILDIPEKKPLMFVNGFCTFTDAVKWDDAENRNMPVGGVRIWNMSTGKQVTDTVYEDVKWFENGFCPVKREGHWGFINESGKEVTDMIWDDVTALYDGKAYVGTGGTYGVLDLETTMAKIDHVTQSNCYPEGLRKASPAPAGEEPEEVSAAVIVKAEHLNIRKDASASAEKAGQVQYGWSYPAYEIKENEGYTWYRIGDDMWIADQNGEWVKYYSSTDTQ